MRGDFAPEGITIDPGYQCFASIQRPTSRGKVWIESADPKKAPKFQFNYLSTDYDRDIAIAAIKATREIFQQPAWNGRLTPELSGVHQLKSNQDIMQWLILILSQTIIPVEHVAWVLMMRQLPMKLARSMDSIIYELWMPQLSQPFPLAI